MSALRASPSMRPAGRALEWWKARIETKSAAHGLAYPWWIPDVSATGQLACAAIALQQRDALAPPQWSALTLLLVGLGPTLQLVLRTWVPWWVQGALVLGATGWLLTVSYPNKAEDLAPALLMLMIAEVTASTGPVPGMVMSAASLGLIGGFFLDDSLPVFTVNALGVVLALVVGYMLLWQTRALSAEKHARVEERARATVAERERIAREIHDLVAHSLSVTLLHLAGAKHSLRDGEVTEAMDALDDAERIGRQAMADIRRTVAGLSEPASDHALTRPLPTAADIDTLVAEFSAAGLDVRYSTSGDISRLPAPAGLGLYRICQEALSNVAKHAPRSTVTLSMDLGRSEARLTARNDLAGRTRTAAGSAEAGGGVPGMTARATGLGGTIRVGPQGDTWVVEVRLPLTADAACALRRVT